MRPINLHEYKKLAEARLEPAAWDYYAGGADDEVTVQENESAFRRLWLLRRVLVDVSSVNLSTTALGTMISA